MAKSAQETKIGGFVYRPFEIMKPGVVIGEVYKSNSYRYLKVKWLDGSDSEEWELHLNDFNYATDEHLKKFNKFEAIRQKLRVI